ncbi:MAG: zf-HC2 domain-containing protein [Terracidiphilus sp.]
MNPVSQFDVHPDAESLNGFVERQLPEAERAQVIEHLASCGRCRQIVYLVQDAAPAAEQRVPAVAGEREDAGRKPWRCGGGFAWATAAACAALAIFAVFVPMRKTARPAEMAKASPPATVSSAVNAPIPAASAALVEKSRSPNRQADARQLATKPPSPAAGSAGTLSGRDVSTRLAAPAIARQSRLKAIRNAIAGTKSSDEPLGSIAAGAANAPAQSPSLATHEVHFHGSAGAVGADALAAKAPPTAKSESAPEPASEAVEVNADQVQSRPEAASRAQLQTIAPAAQAAAEKNSGLTLLPSGLPVVSMVAAGRNIVAIDAVGSLFLSRDLEKSWEPIERQWIGQAVKVRIAQAPGTTGPLGSFAAQSGSPRPKASIAASVSGAIFELVNDSNAVWTSADGKTWKAK